MHHPELTAAGARLAGVSVDSPEQNAAMVEKLHLPFPLLSDVDGEGAIKPYGLWHEERSFSLPAVVVVGTDGTELLRQVGEDFADRLPEPELVDAVRARGLPAVIQERPRPGRARPGARAAELVWLPAYFRGARFAVTRVAGRIPAAQEDAEAMSSEYERFLGALEWLGQ